MREHTWKVGDHLEIRAGDRIITGYDGKRTAGPALLEPFIVEEILKLATDNAALKRKAEAAHLHNASAMEIMKSRIAALEAEVERLREDNAYLAATRGADDLRGFVVWHRHDGDMVKLIPIPAERETAIDSMEVAEGPPIKISLFP